MLIFRYHQSYNTTDQADKLNTKSKNLMVIHVFTLFELLNASSTNVKYSSKSLRYPVGKIKYMEEPL